MLQFQKIDSVKDVLRVKNNWRRGNRNDHKSKGFLPVKKSDGIEKLNNEHSNLIF